MRTSIIALLLVLVAAPPAAAQYDETENWLNAYGRTVDHFSAPDRSVQNALISAQSVLDTLTRESGQIPERGLQQFGAWPWNGDVDCSGYYRQGSFEGRLRELEFTAADGTYRRATVWAPAEADGPLPGIVYAPGVISAQPMYCWFAQGMANNGYVVMTYDLGGQGKSQGYSTVQDPPGDLRAALDFFVSDANPFRRELDVGRIGTAGHSLGASAVQAVGDHGGLVKAISAHSDLAPSYTGNVPIQGQGADYETFVLPPAPTPQEGGRAKLDGFDEVRARGVDTQEVVIESGTHMAWSHVTWAYTASWSETVALHYALAWFDRYLYADKRRWGLSATRRLTMNFDAGGGHGVSRKFTSAWSLRGSDGVTRYCADMVAGECRPPAEKRAKTKRKRRRQP